MIASSCCFCKAGRHRSHALRIAFLMWAGHVHDHSVWADLIAPVRNKVRRGLPVKCELIWVETLGRTKLQKGYVPFGDVLLMFADYLNRKDEPHRWPVHAR